MEPKIEEVFTCPICWHVIAKTDHDAHLRSHEICERCSTPVPIGQRLCDDCSWTSDPESDW
jgi:hypothetical protein